MGPSFAALTNTQLPAFYSDNDFKMPLSMALGLLSLRKMPTSSLRPSLWNVIDQEISACWIGSVGRILNVPRQFLRLLEPVIFAFLLFPIPPKLFLPWSYGVTPALLDFLGFDILFC